MLTQMLLNVQMSVHKADTIFSPFVFIAKTEFHFVSWINLPIYTVNSNDSYSINAAVAAIHCANKGTRFDNYMW